MRADNTRPELKLASEQSRRHEQKTNKVVGLASLGLVAINVVTQLMLFFDYSQNVSNANHYIFLPLSVLLVVFYLIAWRYHFDASWIKYMLTGGIVLMTTGLFFVFTTFAAYFVLLPLVISIRYFRKEFIAKIAAVSAFLFAVACELNLRMNTRWELVRFAHESNLFDPWGRDIDALIFLIIPLGMTAIFVAVYGIELTKNGRGLLNVEAQAASRIAAVETELQMAAEIQRSALPPAAFAAPDGRFVLEAREIPAREVGGDFYDYYMLGDHTLAVLMADVSDKGVPAAMFMMSAKKAVRCAVECADSLQKAIVLANRLICQDNESKMFLTLWLGIIDTQTGVGKYINAGHPSPIIRRADGSISWLTNEPDLFLGTFPDQPPAVHTFSMAQGDTLLLYTDGITDSMNPAGERFGTQGVYSALEGCRGDAEAAAERVMERSAAFAAGEEQFDDMTLLALQCLSLEPLKQCVMETRSGTGATARIIDGLNGLLEQVDCPEDVRRNADIVADELCANIADYAYDGAEGPLSVRAEAGHNLLRLVFTDEGEAFDPLGQADPQLSGEPVLGGLGIYFVKNLTDRLSYRRMGQKNELTVEMIWGF